MTGTGGNHESFVQDALRRLGREPRDVRSYELLQGGVSGSSVYRLASSQGESVLKVTLAASAPYVHERARREAMFYRSLADSVPLRVPEVLAVEAEHGGDVLILLAAYRQSRPPDAWREADYLLVAEELGRFHATYWGRTDVLGPLGWLRAPRAGRSASQVRAAAARWREIAAAGRPSGVSSGRSYGIVSRALERVGDLERLTRTTPLTLCHGDCHMGNVLCTPDGQLVWADWQEVGVGYGIEDLSFFFQRARFDGGTVPYELAVRVYAESLQAHTGTPMRVDEVRRAADGAELLSWLLVWPEYLAAATGEQLDRVLDRVRGLAERLAVVT